MYRNFEWPIPPFYELPPGEEFAGHEPAVVSLARRQLMQRRAPASELRAAAIRHGMRTLKQDGIEKRLLGLTDMQEVRAMTA